MIRRKKMQTEIVTQIPTTLTDNQQILCDANLLLPLKGGNVRKKRSQTAQDEMRHSIITNGIIQPVVARPHPTLDGKLQLLAGYGRQEMAQELNIPLPVLIRVVEDKEALEIHLAENMVRSDLSLVDEVHAAKRYLSFYNGDRKSVSCRLGWSLKKLNERLELLNAAPEVLDALDEGKVKANFAMLLSTFETEKQSKTIEVALKERWTFKELKQRAESRQILLSKAIFEQNDCTGCQHNTVKQVGLFDMDDDVAKCAKPSCYQEKTKAKHKELKLEAEEKFGTVLWLSESLRSDRNDVNESLVGKKQFNSCMGCESRVAVINNDIYGQGEVIESQCVDLNCFKKCVSKFAKTNSPKISTIAENEPTSALSNNITTEKGTASEVPKPISPKTPIVVFERHKIEVREFAANHLANNLQKLCKLLALLNWLVTKFSLDWK